MPVDKEAIAADLLANLAARWNKRVAVKMDEPDMDGHFDPDSPDFPLHLLPFCKMPEYDALDQDKKMAILGAAWIAYNAKTAAVEEEVILPACRAMIDGRVTVTPDDAVFATLH